MQFNGSANAPVYKVPIAAPDYLIKRSYYHL